MQETLAKIRGIQKTNEEIIERVEGLQEVKFFDYYLETTAECQVSVKETVTVTRVSDIIKNYKFDGVFKMDIWDIFNDKLDWSTNAGWEDLKRLNRAMLAVANKFILLDKTSEEARAELAKYLHNFEVIQVGLGAVEEHTISQQSILQSLKAETDRINQRFKEEIQALLKKGVKTGPPPKPVPDFAGGDLLNAQHITELVGWYGKGWKLQYKGSRDGFAATDFHRMCDGEGSTVTVIKANDCLFGGYLSISWHNVGNDIHQGTASLFTLTNKHSIPPTQFAYSRGRVAYFNASNGPVFGSGSDIRVNNDKTCYTGFPNSFEDTTGRHLGSKLFAGANDFSIAEIEVYTKQ